MWTCCRADQPGTTFRDRDHIDLVWLRPERGLARRLRKEPGWDVVYQDKVSVLMKHAPTGRVAAR